MARCGCGGTCSCLIEAGSGVQVDGIGSVENPYIITSDASELVGRLEFVDSSTIDFTAAGVGTDAAPMTVTAVAQVSVSELTDVQGAPVNGQVLVWVDDHWEPQNQTGGGGGSGVPAGGTDGQVLTKQSNADGDANWESPGSPVVEPVYSSARRLAATFPVPNGTWTVVPLDTPLHEDGIPWSTTTPQYAYVIPVDGYYQIDGGLSFVAGATGSRNIGLYANGGQLTNTQVPGSTPTAPGITASVTVKCVAGDYISLRAWQNSTATLNLVAGVSNTWLAVTKVPSLAAAGGGVVVDRPASSRRFHNGTTSILNATITKVPFDTADTSNDVPWDAAASAFIAPSDGYYDVEGSVTWAANATGTRNAYVYVGAALKASFGAPAAAGADQFATTVKAVAGEEISVRVQQTSGASLNVGGGSAYNHVSVTRVPASYSGSAVSTFGERIYSSARAHTVATSIVTATYTPIPFNTEQWTDGITWNGTDAFVVPVAGYYQVDAVGTLASNATGVRSISVMLNGTFVDTVQVPAASSGAVGVGISATVKAAAGDLISVRIYQNSGVNVALATGANNNYVAITKVPAPVVNGAAVSGVWGVGPMAGFGSNDLIGREIYIDSKGQLRSKPVVDSGWLPLTGIASGWTVPSPYVTPQARLYGNEVIFRGRLVNASFTGGYTDLAQLPVGIPNPLYTSAFPMATNTPATRTVQIISGTGVVQTYSSAASASHIDFASVRYPIT